MRIYQLYKWDNHMGPSVTFFSNKADATKSAKYWVKQGTMDGDVVVSVLNVSSKKSDIINLLNSIDGNRSSNKATTIMSYESKMGEY
tara:strand:+ start:45 stop:305 length:261 start_codon:yes stop_codon:yes gene_type:complete